VSKQSLAKNPDYTNNPVVTDNSGPLYRDETWTLLTTSRELLWPSSSFSRASRLSLPS